MSSLEKQVGGNHYKRFKIQPIELIVLNNLNFLEGNVVKYVCRHRFKDGLKDLKKAKHYIEMLIDFKDKFGKELPFLKFVLANEIPYSEGKIIDSILKYSKSGYIKELGIALDFIDYLIEDYKIVEKYKCSENS